MEDVHTPKAHHSSDRGKKSKNQKEKEIKVKKTSLNEQTSEQRKQNNPKVIVFL